MIIFRARVAGPSDATLARFVARLRRTIPLAGMVNVVLTTDRDMKSLNARFRKRDEATDVLSFPSNGMDGLAGEIAISMETARRNARLLGHSISDEIKVLILHGMLHLAGHDHKNQSDGGKMAREEGRLRKVLRLPSALIERSGTIEPNGTKSAAIRRPSQAKMRPAELKQ